MRWKLLIHHRMPTLSLCDVILLLAPLLLWLPYWLPLAQAQTPITASGLNTIVSDPIQAGGSTQYNITGGTRPGGGTNLFHSFGEFNVPTNNIANFLNDSGLATTNILGRVTAGNPSNIFGTIQTTDFGIANLFLMNPAGIVFGPNASLNVGGSVTFTTADYIRLADGGRFNANPAAIQPDILTAAPVAAFGFLGSNPAAINFEGGQLTVANGTGLTLVGGDINLMPDALGTPSSITAPSRPLQLTSVAGPGEVAADTAVPTPGIALGTITLGEGTVLSTAGDPSFGDGSGGVVSIRGGQFVATGASILANPAFGSTGQGGAINMTASKMTLQDSSIGTEVFGDGITSITGGGGSVTLTGTQSVTLTKSTIHTDSFFSNGNGGAVTIEAPIIFMEESFIATSALGDGITPIIGNGGAVTLSGTTSVSLQRSSISTESFETQGNSGVVTITAPTVTIAGSQATQGIITSAHSFSGDPKVGNGGNIEIKGTEVTFTDFAHLESVADSVGTPSRGGNILITGDQNILLDNGASFVTTTISEGNAGNIELMSQKVTMKGQGTLASDTFGPGGGGTIKITATDQVTMTGGASMTASSTGPGNAGNISVNAGQRLEMQDSSITTQASQAGGGNVDIQAVDRVRLLNSTISTSVLGGSGSGGNISIDPHSVILQNSQIIAQAVQGAGGNITITTPLFLADQASLVDASSQFGINGTVNIQSPTSNLAGTVASLPSSMRQAQGLQTGRCAALANSQSSSFLIAGRETIPTEPGGWLTSPLAYAGPDSDPFAEISRPATPLMAMTQDTVSLRRLTPAGFLTQSFAEGESTGCRS